MIGRGVSSFVLSSLILGGASAASQTMRTATLNVPASALVFTGDGLQAPDAEGHFAVGIKLPQLSIRTANCDSDNLIVGMGSLNKPQANLTAADLQTIARNRDYYSKLVAAAKLGVAVAIHVRNKPDYLAVTNGVVFARYCALSIDEELTR